MIHLSEVTIGITSFLRHRYLLSSCVSIAQYLPECCVIIADDSDYGHTEGEFDYSVMQTPHFPIGFHGVSFNHKWLQLPFDSGLSAKRNALVQACCTSLFLLWTDDFKADEECRSGVLKMLDLMERHLAIDLVGGRVDNRPYECFLEFKCGEYVKETRFVPPSNACEYWGVDLTVNYFLAKTTVLREVPWAQEVGPIGGEHGQFFLDLWLADRYKVVWVPGVNVKTMTLGPEAKDPRYDSYRARAYELGHQAMKRRYNIQRYIDMNGGIS
jgi:hypothetical protein